MAEEDAPTPDPQPEQAPPYAEGGGNIVLIAGILLIIAVLGTGLWLGTHSQKPPVEQRAGMTPAQRLAAADCKTCHAPEKALVGPSYQAIAARYGGDAGSDAEVARLVRKVKHGGSGVWGSTPMMSHPHLKEPEIESMIRWILSEYSTTVNAADDSTTTDTETTDE